MKSRLLVESCCRGPCHSAASLNLMLLVAALKQLKRNQPRVSITEGFAANKYSRNGAMKVGRCKNFPRVPCGAELAAGQQRPRGSFAGDVSLRFPLNIRRTAEQLLHPSCGSLGKASLAWVCGGQGGALASRPPYHGFESLE